MIGGGILKNNLFTSYFAIVTRTSLMQNCVSHLCQN